MSATQSPRVEAGSTARRARSEARVSLDELIRQQGINPNGNLAEIQARWPKWADPDDLLKFLDELKADEREIAAQRPDSFDLGD